MNYYLILLRLVHIFSGVTWAGTTFFLVSTLIPSARESGPEAGRFLGRMGGSNRMLLFIGISNTLTVLSGILLYGLLTNGFHLDWLSSGRGLVLTIGALAGLTAWLIGLLAMAPNGKRISLLIESMGSAGGPPSPELAAKLPALIEKQAQYGTWLALLLAVAVAGMSTAEYIIF
jgi:uncharacterized membrane protein